MSCRRRHGCIPWAWRAYDLNVRDRFLCFLNGCYDFGSHGEIVRNYARWKQRNRVLALMSRSLQSSTRPFAGFSIALYFPCPPVPIAFTSFPQVFDDRKTHQGARGFPKPFGSLLHTLWLFGRPLSLHCAFRLRILCSRSDINDDAWHVSLYQSLSYVWGDDTLKTYPYVGATVTCVPRRPDKWASELAVYMAEDLSSSVERACVVVVSLDVEILHLWRMRLDCIDLLSCRGLFRSGKNSELPKLLSGLAKAPTPEDPVTVTPGRCARMAPSVAIRTAVSEQIFASSILHCNIMYECCPKSNATPKMFPSVCRSVHVRVWVLSLVTERVSPETLGQYSAIQEQPSDGRCSSCQTQFINGVSSQSRPTAVVWTSLSTSSRCGIPIILRWPTTSRTSVTLRIWRSSSHLLTIYAR